MIRYTQTLIPRAVLTVLPSRSEARRRSSIQSGPSSPQPAYHTTHSEPNRMPFHQQHHQPHPHHPSHSSPISIPTANVPPTSASAPPRSLVWRDTDHFPRPNAGSMHSPGDMMPFLPPPHHMAHRQHASQMPIPSPSHSSPMHMSPGPPLISRPRPRFMDDGMPPSLRDLASPLNWTRESLSELPLQRPVIQIADCFNSESNIGSRSVLALSKHLTHTGIFWIDIMSSIFVTPSILALLLHALFSQE